jgi:hypothetical protein
MGAATVLCGAEAWAENRLISKAQKARAGCPHASNAARYRLVA